MESSAEKIVSLEWEMFQETQNIGGRADCQDNHPTFYVMRLSQALSWTEEIRAAWLSDLRAAKAAGRNLVAEKYARMMESTSPAEYAAIKEALPEVSAKAKDMAGRLAKMMADWAAAAAEKYPKICARGRSFYSDADNLWNTSIETYSRGELMTMSERTLDLLEKYYAEISSKNENLYIETQKNMVRLLGYESLEDAENRAAL